MSHDPIKPLFEDPGASAELRDFVTLARNDGANQADLDRLARRVAPVVGVSAALIATSAAAVGTSAPLAAASAFGAPASGLTAALGSSVAASGAANAGALKATAVHATAAKAGLLSQLMASASAKVLAVGLSVGAAGAAVYGARTSFEPERSAAQGAASVAQLNGRAARPEVEAAGPGPESAGIPEVERAGQVASSLAGSAATALTPSSAEPRVRKSSPVRRAAAEPPAASGAAQPRPSVMPAEKPIVDDPTPAAEAKPVLPPPSELSLIERAEALRMQPSEALAFLVKHEEAYPRGALAQEREVLAIELLLKAGRAGKAQARAQRFEDTYPRSAHLPHVHALLARARGTYP